MTAPTKPVPPPPPPPPRPAPPRPPNRPAGSGAVQFAHDYADAYMTAYHWLFQHCPPWRWLLSSAFWPGSPVWRELQQLKERTL